MNKNFGFYITIIELDWIEQVLGRNETESERFLRETISKMGEQLAKDIDAQIMKDLYIDDKITNIHQIRL